MIGVMRTAVRALLAAVLITAVAGCMSSADVLAGRHWTLASINGNAPAAPASIDFAAKGTLTLDTGCNTGSATFTLRGNRLVAKDLALTLLGCPDNAVAAQETTLTGVLGGSPLFAIDTGTGQLRLTGADTVLLFDAPQG